MEPNLLMSKILTCTALLVIEEKNRKRKRRWWVRPIYQNRINQGDYHNLLREMRLQDTEMFFNYTRMDVHTFDNLLTMVGPALKKNSRRPTVNPECRLALTLRFLASGDSLQSIAFSYRIGKSTVCMIVRETCVVLWDVLQPVVLKYPDRMIWEKCAQQFLNDWQLPNCLGAINGKHVAITAPNKSGSLYYNYKKHFSIVLFAICDAAYLFTSVDIGAYGSQSDGGILRQSAFGIQLQNGLLQIPPNRPLPGTTEPFPHFFVGSEAFPLQPHLMRPFGGKYLSADKRIFNYRLSRARRCIENAFGILVARWRIFHKTIQGFPETVDNIIKATICLHNYIMLSERVVASNSRRYCTERLLDHEDGNEIQPGEWRNDIPANAALKPASTLRRRIGARNSTTDSIHSRDNLKVYFNSEAGSAPWQNDHIQSCR